MESWLSLKYFSMNETWNSYLIVLFFQTSGTVLSCSISRFLHWLQKIEKIREHLSQLFHNDIYSDNSIHDADCPAVEINHMRNFAVEYFRTLISLKFRFYKTTFKRESCSSGKRENVVVTKIFTTTWSENIIRLLWPEI